MTTKNIKKFAIPFNTLKSTFDLKIINKVTKSVFKSGSFILGNYVKEFEQKLAKRFNFNFCVGVASGTDAITLALKACGVGPKDWVLTVANSAPATVAAIANTGANILFCDVDTNGLMDCKEALDIIKNRREIKAVVPVHLYGRVCDISLLTNDKNSDGHNKVMVIEDAAQAAGSESKKYKIGSRSEAVCYSFYPTKNLGCYGDGGAICTNAEYIRNRLQSLRNYGIGAGKLIYEYGYNSRLDELQAAYLIERLKILNHINLWKSSIAEAYCSAFRRIRGLHVPNYDRLCNYHLFPIFTDKWRELIYDFINGGIEFARHYPIAAYDQPIERMARHLRLKNTDWLTENVITLPNYYGMPYEYVRHVISTVRRFFDA